MSKFHEGPEKVDVAQQACWIIDNIESIHILILYYNWTLCFILCLITIKNDSYNDQPYLTENVGFILQLKNNIKTLEELITNPICTHQNGNIHLHSPRWNQWKKNSISCWCLWLKFKWHVIYWETIINATHTWISIYVNNKIMFTLILQRIRPGTWMWR